MHLLLWLLLLLLLRLRLLLLLSVPFGTMRVERQVLWVGVS